MTLQEKAQELVNKFKPHAFNGAVEENDQLMELFHAKQCALIAVNEIITNRERIKGIDKLYWQQVKQEIENI